MALIDTLEMFPFQEENISYEIFPDIYGTEYHSYIYERPKYVIKKCFDNKFIKKDTEDPSDILSGILVLNQAWEQFDRKLRGFEFDTRSPYKDYDNMDCQLIDFTVKKCGSLTTVMIHTYHRVRNIYHETINSQYGQFYNRQQQTVIDDNDGDIIEYMKDGIINILKHFLNSYITGEFETIFSLDKKFENPELLYNI